jgi:hypothetical protein
MTSLGVSETVNATTGTPLPPELLAVVADSVLLEANNPHFSYSNLERRGYGIVKASGDKLEVEFRSPTTIEAAQAEIETLQAFEVQAGTPEVQLV